MNGKDARKDALKRLEKREKEVLFYLLQKEDTKILDIKRSANIGGRVDKNNTYKNL